MLGLTGGRLVIVGSRDFSLLTPLSSLHSATLKISPCYVYKRRLRRLSEMLNNHGRIAVNLVCRRGSGKKKTTEKDRKSKQRDEGSKRMKIKWWGNVRGAESSAVIALTCLP